MFARLLGLATAGVNPLSKFKMVFIALAVISLLAAAGFVGYRIYVAGQNDVLVDTQKQEISRKDGVIADQTKQAENVQEGKKAEDTLIEKIEVKQKSNNKQTAKTVEKLDHQVDVIQTNPDFTPQEKSAAVAQVTIDALWTSYCDAAGGDAAGCSAGTPPAPAVNAG